MATEDEEDVSIADVLTGDDGATDSPDAADAAVPDSEAVAPVDPAAPVYELDGSILLKLTFTGDFTIGDNLQAKGKSIFEKELEKQNNDLNFPFRDFKNIFEKDNLTVLNFEGTLTKAGRNPAKLDNLFLFRADPSYAKILPENGVECVSLENNHVLDMRDSVSATASATPRPFLFAEDAYTADTYERAGVIHLDWGGKDTVSHFVYDAQAGVYQRYCGAGVKPEKWAAFAALTSPEDQAEANSQPLSFANLIVQRVDYTLDKDSVLRMMEQSVGRGNADIFIGGRYIPGVWARASMSAPTVFYDDQGQELQLRRGKTYIALFPNAALCSYAQEP